MNVSKIPESNIFEFDRLISENNLTQSWSATRRDSGERCFLKLPSKRAGLGTEEVRQILLNSYRCQSLIRSHSIVTARARHLHNGTILVEYPHIDQSRWRQFQPDKLDNLFVPTLTQISIIVDYLHLLGLVHCDLKFDNFQIDITGGSPRVILLDLDCLTRSGSVAKARVVGTPGHIPPEVLRNSVFTAQSDHYSLGRSIERHVLTGSDVDGEIPRSLQELISRLKLLVEALTAENPVHRPASLVEGLYQHQLIDRDTFDTARRKLLGMVMVSAFRRSRTELRKQQGIFTRFFLEETGLLGLHPELCQEMELAFRRSPRTTSRLFRSWLGRCELNRYGDFWHAQLTDEVLVEAFGDLSKVTGQGMADKHVNPTADAPVTATPSITSFKDFLLARVKYEKNGREMSGARRLARLKELIEASLNHDRPKDALQFLQEALELAAPESRDSLWILNRLVRQLQRVGRVEECGPLNERGLTEARTLNDQGAELDFRRYQAWGKGMRGEHEQERQILIESIKVATGADLPLHHARALSALAGNYWRKGDYNEAEKYLRESIAIARKANAPDEIGLNLVRLAYLYSELSAYRKSVAYGRLAARYNSRYSLSGTSIQLLRALVYALIRLGEYRKAEYWLGQFLDRIWQLSEPSPIVTYYHSQGWLNVNRGRYHDAKQLFYKALSSLKADGPVPHRGKAYHNLAEIATYQGDVRLAKEYLSLARDLFGQVNDQPSLTELEFIGQFAAVSPGQQPPPENLLRAMKSLLRNHCQYYALLCLFHILLQPDRTVSSEAVKAARALAPVYEKPDSPLARAVNLLVIIHTYTSVDGEFVGAMIKALKAAYGILQAAGHTHLSLLVCQRIAELYFEVSKDKLARKFLQQAITHAKEMGNQELVEVLSKQYSAGPEDQSERSRVLQTFLGISAILKDVKDYDRAMQQVVQFAVEETGAERGVFLVREKQSSNLYVKSFVNFDDQSLTEIADFSRTLPERAIDEFTPLVIEDALQDSTTKRLQSIVAHNIRSVMCIPVSMPGSFSGVLYLDHHTIPALFESDDITFVRALANSLSVIIAIIEQFRGAAVMRRSLSDDLANYGVSSPMITRNEKMLELIRQVHQLAATTSSILITGESGTGKEILCQMIHDNSPRADKPLVKLNCAAIPSTMIESELFGIGKNVATGVSARVGKFEAADGGTLFLDEIGDMQLEVQAKLLRVVEHLGFERIGSNRTIYADVRLIYATNQNLRELVQQEKFRQDLFHRINTIIINIPPLRQRQDDIELLIDHFSKVFAPNASRAPKFTQATINCLMSYSWPGNVRELRNLVERMCILRAGQIVAPDHLPAYIQHEEAPATISKSAKEEAEKAQIRRALDANNWVQSAAAQAIGMPLTTFRRRIRKYRITRGL